MPILRNETERLDEFKRLMENIGLEYSRAYRLSDDGKAFQIEYMIATTAEQYQQAAAILKKTLNKDVE